MAENENRRSKMTRRLLRDALLELLKEKSISQISIKSICERADMNRTTFYLHYQDQYALLNELIDEVYQNTENYMKEVKDKATKSYVTAFLTYVKENADVFRTLLVTNPDKRLEERMIKLSMGNMSEYMPYLPDNAESEYIRIFVSEGSFSLLKNWIRNDFDLSVEQVTSLAWQLPDLIYRGKAVFP